MWPMGAKPEDENRCKNKATNDLQATARGKALSTDPKGNPVKIPIMGKVRMFVCDEHLEGSKAQYGVTPFGPNVEDVIIDVIVGPWPPRQYREDQRVVIGNPADEYSEKYENPDEPFIRGGKGWR